jgi:hypothetical protein
MTIKGSRYEERKGRVAEREGAERSREGINMDFVRFMCMDGFQVAEACGRADVGV